MLKPKRSALRRLAERNVTAVVFEFPTPLKDRLKTIAAQKGMSQSEIVRKATIEALDELEAMKP